MELKLGQEAKDKITGFQGTLTGRATYITGCDQFLLSPKCQDGKNHAKPDGEWFDDGRLEFIKESITFDDVKSDTGNGADIQAPTK